MNENIRKTLDTDVFVTVGLCVKNAEKTIKDCIESIVNQNYPKRLMTVIVVDGKSKDKTVEMAKKQLLSSGILSKFYSDDGAGLGHARQIVLNNTNNKYVVWVDSDVIISKDFVINQVAFMEENLKVGVAAGKSVFQLDASFTLPASLQNLSKYVGSVEFKQTKKYRGLPPNDASIYRVEAAKQVGGFDEKIKGASEDEDIMLRMRGKQWLISVNKEASFHAFPRDTWQSLWIENFWFGYGSHFLHHKHRNLRRRKKFIHRVLKLIPMIYLISGIRDSLRAYKLTLKKSSFLFPIYYFFQSTAWWFGFIRAHMENYGHAALEFDVQT